MPMLPSFWPSSLNRRPFSAHGEPAPHHSDIHGCRPPRTNRQQTRVVHRQIEVIGGPSSAVTAVHALHHPFRPSSQKPYPRFPQELIDDIVILAAASILTKECHQEPRKDSTNDEIAIGGVTQVLELCRVSRSCHAAIFCQILLPVVHLRGSQQVKAFARSLQRSNSSLMPLAKTHVKAIHIRLEQRLEAKVSINPSWQDRPALFDAATLQAKFERETLVSIKEILGTCSSTHILTLECMPRALDTFSSSDRNLVRKRTKQDQSPCAIDEFQNRVTRLSCLLSVYGGQLNDKLWVPDVSSPGVTIRSSKWSNLTHLQLHGPRFRFTAATAMALGHLPSLSHLALIMPALVQNPDGRTTSRSAIDLEGRSNVLQVLVNHCGKLKLLLFVGHDLQGFVGNTERYRSLLRSVYRIIKRVDDGGKGLCSKEPLHLQVVTARRRLSALKEHSRHTGSTQIPRPLEVHPTFFSRWMMDLTEHGEEWSFGQTDTFPARKHHRATLQKDVQYDVDEWDLPDMLQVENEQTTNSDHSGARRSGDRFELPPNVTFIMDEGEQLYDDDDEEEGRPTGIDNLD